MKWCLVAWPGVNERFFKPGETISLFLLREILKKVLKFWIWLDGYGKICLTSGTILIKIVCCVIYDDFFWEIFKKNLQFSQKISKDIYGNLMVSDWFLRRWNLLIRIDL